MAARRQALRLAARAGTTAECRHQRSCRPGVALLLRRIGPVSWPSREDLRKRAGASAFGAGLLSLCQVRKRILPAGSCSAARIVFAHTWRSADDGQFGGAGELEERRELAGVVVSAKQVERAAEALGVEIADEERRCVEKMGAVAPTMYLGMDGTGVPMRAAELAARAGKQPDGSAKTREAKVVTLWTAESRDAEGTPMRDPGSVTYSAAIDSAATSYTSPRAVRLRRARAARSNAPRLHASLPLRRAGRWLYLDLEHRPGTVPPSHSDSRPLPRQRSFTRCGHCEAASPEEDSTRTPVRSRAAPHDPKILPQIRAPPVRQR